MERLIEQMMEEIRIAKAASAKWGSDDWDVFLDKMEDLIERWAVFRDAMARSHEKGIPFAKVVEDLTKQGRLKKP